MRVLVIEDEVRLSGLIRQALEEEGYTVTTCLDGESAEMAASSATFDLFLVDWRLPKRSGVEFIAGRRSAGDQTPALLLTAFGDVSHRVEGLDAGADDYLPKPFAFEELLARLRALTRRAAAPRTGDVPLLRVGPLELDPDRRLVRLDGAEVPLRRKEFDLLELFLRHPDRTFSRTDIARAVWGDEHAVAGSNALDVTISHLRSKLTEADPRLPLQIEAVRGTGYRLRDHTAD